MAIAQYQKIIFGLKVRQLRQEFGWNFDDLSKKTDISVSYLNEIEKGKKYPQPTNQDKLASALNTTKEFLNSPEMVRQYAPLGNLLKSKFLNELPLDFFGIELQMIVEIIARAPERVNAFISALLEIARNYSLREENFFFAALRTYQELRNNYFEELEDAADDFVTKHHLPDDGGISSVLLLDLLRKQYKIKVESADWTAYPELNGVRSLYNPQAKRLILHEDLTETQRSFYLAKELGFQYLNLQERPYASTLLSVKSFEIALNNYRAAYFAVAILVNKKSFVSDVKRFFDAIRWNEQTLIRMMDKYQASPEVLFQRFNLLTKDFKLDKVFFQRFIHDTKLDKFDIDKEIHLNRPNQAHSNGLREHYCRRWLSIKLLKELNEKHQNNQSVHAIAGIQRVRFIASNEEYLCVAIAKRGFQTSERNVSVALGVLLDEHAKSVIRFWNDPNIAVLDVNVTCERCEMANCQERVQPPLVIEKMEYRRKVQATIQKFTNQP